MNIVVLGAGTAGLITALMIREKYPLVNITVVKSGELGIVGVGEGSTEHWMSFMNFVGIDVLELIYETKATIKIGILFKNWSSGPDYAHSVFTSSLSGLGRHETFNYLHLNRDAKNFPLSPGFENTYYKNRVYITPNFKPSNQFHFDTFKLNDYLVKKCVLRNIGFIDAIVTDVLLDNNGNIQELITEKNNIPGDLFIDCSGFRRVLSKKLDNNWVSKAKYLPLNTAIAFPTDLDDPLEIEPFTTSTALSAGWSWKIPTQDRYGNGYVFDSNYINADSALAEINQVLGKNVEKAAREIKFEAGKIDKFWKKNVVSVGLSGSFAEPLEAQSIGFTIIQAQRLLACLDVWPYNKKISEKYNYEMDEVFDNVIDYLQLHYLGDRCDTKFWKDKPFELTDFIKDNMPLFKQGIFDPSLTKDLNMFKISNYYQVLAGLNLIDKTILQERWNNNRASYNIQNVSFAEEQVKNITEASTYSHQEFIKISRDNYFIKKAC